MTVNNYKTELVKVFTKKSKKIKNATLFSIA